MAARRSYTSGVKCSARGCQATAVWALQWNNPKLHDPERRKTWLACDTHRETLGEFLTLRGFLREVTVLGETGPGDAGPGDAGPGETGPDEDRATAP
ncbi:hypothetical protein WEI85_19135 [Actinomycetes bacterium KLBMP 9797]